MGKKTLIFTALLILLAPVPFAIPSEAAIETCNTFTIENYSSFALGDVTIAGDGGQTVINVPGQGTFDTTICYIAASVAINGQSVDYPNSAVVTLVDGSLVNVGWQSPNLVEVGNDRIINTPVR